MKITLSLTRLVYLIILLLMMGMSMSACAKDWKEEVLLHDGSKIVVKRIVERGGRHEIGQQPPFKEQSMRFTMPGTNQEIIWNDNYSEDLGSANFLPMLLDVYDGIPYVVVHPMGHLSYAKWGKPNPPYVIFKYDKGKWRRIPLQELPPAIKVPNLIFSSPDTEVEKTGKHLISLEMIKAITAGYTQPEYRTILRTPLDHWKSRPEHTGPKAPHPITPPNSMDGKK